MIIVTLEKGEETVGSKDSVTNLSEECLPDPEIEHVVSNRNETMPYIILLLKATY